MSRIWIAVLVLSGCSVSGTSNQGIMLGVQDAEEEWFNYEGSWTAGNGRFDVELSLRAASFGVDAPYKLRETFRSDSLSNGTSTESIYSGYLQESNEIAITLHNLSEYNEGRFFRYRKSTDSGPEMYFLTRGNDELLPCDDQFRPLVTDWRYTLHRRSRLFTVEGYVTVMTDSVSFFERNAREYWRVAELGGIDEVKREWTRHAKSDHEGIYLKALAYSVRTPGVDSVSNRGKDLLVIKTIKNIGREEGR